MTPRQRIVFFSLILIGLALDLWTKAWAFDAVKIGPFGPEEISVIDGFFSITKVRNPGAMWGIGQDVPAIAWIALRGTISVGLLIFVLRQKLLSSWLVMAFGLILAGALGNLHDNVFAEDGMVRDFVHWIFWGWSFPAFNVADACITVGATILFFNFLAADYRAFRAKRAARAAARVAGGEDAARP